MTKGNIDITVRAIRVGMLVGAAALFSGPLMTGPMSQWVGLLLIVAMLAPRLLGFKPLED